MEQNGRIPHLYIYTRKIYSINDEQQNYDLIPKLFYNRLIYNLIDYPDEQECLDLLNTELTDIKQRFAELYPDRELNKVNIYEFLLREYESPNLTRVRYNFFGPNYWRCIIEILQSFVQYGFLNNSANDIPQIDLFITHLLRGHENMQYGLYFSFKLAYDDNDFYRYTLQEYQSNTDLIYFMKLGELLEYVEPLKAYYINIFQQENSEFEPPLLYANNGWDYGMINDNTVELEGLEVDMFFTRIYGYRQFNIQSGELIYQLPLPINQFRVIYLQKDVGQLPFGPFQKKYLKYKEKYMELKKRLELQ
jgi:hypothetical protein